MIELKADIIDYLGKYENGVLVLLNIEFEGKFTEGTLFYSDKFLTLTVDPSVEDKLGTKIEFWPGYRDLLISILKRVVPYNEIINRLDEVDFSQYFIQGGETETSAEEIDESDIDYEE